MSNSEVLDSLLNGNDLDEEQAYDLMQQFAAGDLDLAFAGALLAGLRAKGETAEEIRGFARAMRELSVDPRIPDGAPGVDVVGTGGDGSGSLNISTGAGLLAAAAGSRVIKHGNRSVSSKSGSADLLECLGMTLPLPAGEDLACIEATGFTFLFAPSYHPAMQNVVPVRAAMGVRTVFNVLGPLTNPAAPPFMLIGAYSKETARLMADALSGLDLERAFVVHGELGWDEATPAGAFVLHEVIPGKVKETIRTPEDYGMQRCSPEDLAGGDAEYNANELARVFTGEDRGAHRDALLMGVSLMLEVQGHASGPLDGVEQAAAAIDDGRAEALLDNLRAHFEG